MFNYVYCCGKSSLGNGDYESGDGARFRGRGFIQLTGRWNYENLLYKPWKKMHTNDSRTLEQIVELLDSDIDLAVQVAMIYWKSKGVNKQIISTKFNNDDEIIRVSAIVNTGNKNSKVASIKHLNIRQVNTINAYNILKE